MRHRIPVLWLLAALVSVAAGCAGGTTAEQGDVIAQFRVDPGGEVEQTSGDDSIDIDVPAGAVTEQTLITVDVLTAASILEELDTSLAVDPATEVLRFRSDHELLQPFTVRVRTEQDTLATGIDFAVFVPIALARGGAVEVAGSPSTDADDATGDVHLQFQVDPERILVGEQEGGFYLIAESDLFVFVETTVPGQTVPPPAALGDVVDTHISLLRVPGGGLSPVGDGAVSLNAPGWDFQCDPDGDIQFGDGLPVLTQEGGTAPDWACKSGGGSVGQSRIAWNVDIDNEWNTEGTTPVSSHEDYRIMASTYVVLDPRSDPASIGPLVKADQISFSPAAMFGLSGTSKFAHMFVGFAPNLAFITTEDEIIERTVVSNLTPNPTIGGVALTTGTNWFSKSSLASAAPQADALLFYGNSGYSIRHWVTDIDDFGATEIDPNSGSVSDVDSYEEDKSRAVVVQSGRNQVRFVEYVTDPFPPFNARFTMLDVLDKGIAPSLFPTATGFVISAARRTNTSPVYFVTVGATPDDPGSLWRKDDPTDRVTPATLVGSVGKAPRRVRFLKSIGIVSNSFSDSLTILVRDASDSVTIKGTVDVGDGPIGIDLVELPNGTIGVVSAGFLDNTYTVAILEPDGDVVSNVTAPVPNGGLNPACAVFANAEGTKVAVSCSGSDEVIIFTIG